MSLCFLNFKSIFRLSIAYFFYIFILCRVIQILCFGQLLSYFTPGQKEISKDGAWLYAAGIVAPTLLKVITFHPFMLYSCSIGIKMRLGCAGLVYRKILKLSKATTDTGLSGRAINILSNDLGVLDSTMTYVHDAYRGPVEIFFFGYLMYQEIGISAVIGVGFMLLFLPVQALAAKKTASFRRRAAARTDIRVKLMNEIIQGIQVIKMYAWEKPFAAVIAKIRKSELSSIRGGTYIQAALYSIYMISGISVFLSLVSYVLSGHRLTAKNVFTVSSYFNALIDSFVQCWPMALTCWAQTYVSARRVKEFLLQEGSIDYKIGEERGDGFGRIGTSKRILDENSAENAIIFQNVTAYWDNRDSEDKFILKGVNFEVKTGELMAVIGPVGAGKTSLLNVIIGELNLQDGEATINGTVSYASQENWVFEGTIQDNIVFTENFDQSRYDKVVEACALRADFSVFPCGDQTIVGERGISLSGGQKARVNLARAVYKNADIYLLDDPLSAVDTHVGHHIFQQCIKRFLKDKTCILVTHQLQFLKDIEHILLINVGRIQAQGSFQDLLDRESSKFLNGIQSSGSGEQKKNLEGKADEHDEKGFSNRTAPVSNAADRVEQQAEGSVGVEVYKSYFRTMDNWFLFLVISALFFITRALLSGVDYFLSRWLALEWAADAG